MIDPKPTDIGRKVVYRGTLVRDDAPDTYVSEEGVISSIGKHYIFVRYGADTTAKATRRCDLEWAKRSRSRP